MAWLLVLIVALPWWAGVGYSALVVGVPLFGLYQVSALLQFLTEHAWMRSPQAPPSITAYAERCWGRFLGEACPRPQTRGLRWAWQWSRWWVRMLFVHAPVRLACVVGDLPAHDWHHLNGFIGGDMARWPMALFDRQRAVTQQPVHPLAEQMGRQELWGLHAMLTHVFDLLADSPSGVDRSGQPDIQSKPTQSTGIRHDAHDERTEPHPAA